MRNHSSLNTVHSKLRKGPDWVRYFPGSVLAAVVSVSPAAELAHRRLADYFWSNGRWADPTQHEDRTVARATARQWPAIRKQLATLGWQVGDGVLINKSVLAARAEAVRFLRQRRAGAAATNRARKERALSERTAHAGHGAEQPPLHSKDSTGTGTDNTVNTEHLMRSVSVRGKPHSAEKELLGELKEIYEQWRAGSSGLVMENWGGWWRNRIREDADKARRILAEMRVLVREGRVIGEPGAAGADLWKRLP